MEIVSFTFGVLSVVAVVFASVIVLSIVKVLKLQKQITELQENLNHTHTQIFDGDNDLQNIHRRIDETHSYVDSRIDKLTGTLGAKQSINS